MDGLPYGALHQVDVAHDLVRESVPEMLVEFSVLKIVYKHEQFQPWWIAKKYTVQSTYRPFAGSRSEFETRGRNPTWKKEILSWELFHPDPWQSLRVGRLLLEHGVHVDSEERPENLRVLHQKIREPRESLH